MSIDINEELKKIDESRNWVGIFEAKPLLVFILSLRNSSLGHPLTDFDVTLRVYFRELTLNWCNVIFSTSVSNLKLEASCFSSCSGSSKFRNRKSKIFQKIFAPYVWVHSHTRTKIILVPTWIMKSENEDRTL